MILEMMKKLCTYCNTAIHTCLPYMALWEAMRKEASRLHRMADSSQESSKVLVRKKSLSSHVPTSDGMIPVAPCVRELLSLAYVA